MIKKIEDVPVSKVDALTGIDNLKEAVEAASPDATGISRFTKVVNGDTITKDGRYVIDAKSSSTTINVSFDVKHIEFFAINISSSYNIYLKFSNGGRLKILRNGIIKVVRAETDFSATIQTWIIFDGIRASSQVNFSASTIQNITDPSADRVAKTNNTGSGWEATSVPSKNLDPFKFGVTPSTTADLSDSNGFVLNVGNDFSLVRVSRIWEYIKSKITGAASTIVSSDLTAGMALVSDTDGKVAASDITTTELSVLKGSTSASTGVTLVDTDRVVVNDDGTMKQVAVSAVWDYVNGKLPAAPVAGTYDWSGWSRWAPNVAPDSTITSKVIVTFADGETLSINLQGGADNNLCSVNLTYSGTGNMTLKGESIVMTGSGVISSTWSTVDSFNTTIYFWTKGINNNTSSNKYYEVKLSYVSPKRTVGGTKNPVLMYRHRRLK